MSAINPEQLIGNTPLLRLRKCEPEGVRIYGKLESYNLTGSVKDRPVLKMLQAAEGEGELKPGGTLLEATSGNTGISLATLCAMKGYRLKAVVPENATPERISMMRSAGAEIIFSPAEEGSNGAVALADGIGQENEEWIRLNQYSNPNNPLSHYEGTGPEIFRDLPKVDTFVAGLGTSGTLMGVGKYLKEQNSSVTIVAAEPKPGENIQGLRSLQEGYIPPIFNMDLIDRKILISSRDSILQTQALLRKEGLFLGISAGTALAAALRVAGKDCRQIVVLLPDGGDRYLSSGIFTVDAQSTDLDVSGLW